MKKTYIQPECTILLLVSKEDILSLSNEDTGSANSLWSLDYGEDEQAIE